MIDPGQTILLKARDIRTVALAGNPNSGKTTVFNVLTNLRQKVGNYPGVTVERKMGQMSLPDGRGVDIVDLPGTYSLAVRSPDEQVVRDVLLGRVDHMPRPDVVVCVVDAGNLERHLYLVTQIQDLGLPVIVALNMMDEAKEQGLFIDSRKLADALGAPVIPMVASRRKGFSDLRAMIAEGVDNVYRRKWRLPPPMEDAVLQLQEMICLRENINRFTAFTETMILLCKDKRQQQHSLTRDQEILRAFREARHRLDAQGVDCRAADVEARYLWIKEVMNTAVERRAAPRTSVTDRVDAVLTHKFWGWVFFFGIMGLMFFAIFTLASYPMDWLDRMFQGMADAVRMLVPPGDLRDLLTDGIIAGVGGVLIFLPQILILFFFIGLMQDTGYMVRAAFIMDRVMSKAGLHGKSFIPLLSSFACAIPGVMATRSIENPKDRLITILVAPLMSCSARLPVYTIMIVVLIPNASSWQKAGVLLTLYSLGIVGALVMAWVFKKTLLQGETPIFVMELPPYRWPSVKAILLHMWERGQIFLRKAGTVILAFSIVLWALMTYPKHTGVGGHTAALAHSFAGMIGSLLQPIIQPIGFDWRIGIGLVGSFAAREVFISTMNIVFHVGQPGSYPTLQQAFHHAAWPGGAPLFTPLTCISILIFYVYGLQCLSTVAVVRRETNGWRWPLFQLAYMSFFAYAMSFLVYQGGHLLGFR